MQDNSLPYGSYPIPQSAPERLAGLALLHGLPTPAPQRCRILELGCASGGNLIPLAAKWPDSELVGVDLSAAEIDRAERMVAELGLKNITFYAKDVADLGDSLGQFDMVIAHGLFSWVPQGVQASILNLIRRSLTPNGLAYLSYNTLPGWYRRRVARDVIRLFGQTEGDEAYQVAVARGSLEIFSEILPQSDAPYASAMHAELERLTEAESSYIAQEYLAAHNEQFYAKELFERFERHGLLQVADAFGFNPRLVGDADAMVRAVREEVSDHWADVDAYFDFLTDRTLRCSILRLAGAALPEQIDSAELQNLHFVSPLSLVEGASANSYGPTTYRSQLGATLVIADPLTKCAIQALEAAWPDSLAHADLQSQVAAALGQALSAEQQGELAQALLSAVGRTTITALSGPRHASAPGSRCAWHVARAYAQSGSPYVPTLTHHAAPAGPLARALLALLDGQRSLPELASALTDAAQAGAFGVAVRGERLTETASLVAFFTERLPEMLGEFGRLGLLVPQPAAGAGVSR